MAIAWLDEETGNEMVFFERRGRWYGYLRDPITKRFIRRIYEIYVYVSYSIDYDSQDKPIFADFFAFSKIEIDPQGNFRNIVLDKIAELRERLERYIINNYGSQLLPFLEEGTSKKATHLVKGYGMISRLPSDIELIQREEEGIYELIQRKREAERGKERLIL